MTFMRIMECGVVVGLFLIIWGFIIGEVVDFALWYAAELKERRFVKRATREWREPTC